MAHKILIIDKDSSHANALGVYLERKRLEVYTAYSHEDVLTKFEDFRVDIVLADLFLPRNEMGFMVKQIKKTHPKTQIIIMAETEQLDEAMEQLGNDAVHYLIKPVKSTALDMAVKQARSWIVLNNKLDIQKKRLKELHDARSLYHQLFDEVPCYISVQDKEFRLTATNKKFKRDFGDEIGSHCFQIYKHRESPCEKCPVADTLVDGLNHSTEEVVTSKSGEQINVLTWTAPIRNSSGKITQVMEMSTNITQIRQLQDHLISLGLMIGSMSHGVKGMLTALDGGIYQLETGLAKQDMERTNRAFGNVKQMSERIRKMVLEILYYAKSRELRYEPVDVDELVGKIVDSVKAMADKNGIRLEVNNSESLGLIEIDPNWMQAALVNFMENAVDACAHDQSEKDHIVTLDVFQRENDRVCFIIQDNGMGMDQETREKMFTLFFTSKGSQGTGLGLFIANRVIRNHGGSISVASQPSEGSRIDICLPRKRQKPSPIVEFPDKDKVT